MAVPFRRSLLPVTYVLAAAVLAGTTGVAGYYLGTNNRIRLGIPSTVRNAQDDAPAGVDFSLFWQAWNLVKTNFVGTVDDEKRLAGAINGMAAGTGDPYTLYFAPQENEQFLSDIKGSFGGIGAELTSRNGLVTIVAPMEGSPSAKVGLLAQDVIVQINGEKTEGMDFNDAIAKIRGEKGTTVTLKIARPGATELQDFVVTRDTIVVKSLSSSTISAANDIAYIKLNSFGEDSTALMKTALTDAVAANRRGIVLDLRNNPGGLVQTASDIAGFFLPQTIESDTEALRDRAVLVEHLKDGSQHQVVSTSDTIAPTIPLVILVNGGSASASEILAGALRDYGRATIIGTQSFGKGSEQQLFPLENGGSMKVTIAKWFTPKGVGIDGKGLAPDTVVELPAGTPISSTDEQVQSALSFLK